MFFKYKKNLSGFTLLEMTIALGIFVILFTLTLGIYSSALQAEQRTIQISKLQKEAQFIMEIIAKKVRSGRVDYSYYPSGYIDPDGVTSLALLDSSGNQTVFKFEDQNISVCIASCASPDNFFIIPPTDINVASLNFFISPDINPFVDINVAPSSFPKITVVIDLENTRVGHSRHLQVQQTIPQRLAGF